MLETGAFSIDLADNQDFGLAIRVKNGHDEWLL